MRWPVSPLLLVCRGTSTGRHAAAAVASSCTSNDAIVRDAGLLVWAATDVDGARLAFLCKHLDVDVCNRAFFEKKLHGVLDSPLFYAFLRRDI